MYCELQTLCLTTRKDLGHAVELRHDAFLALCDADRVMEDGSLGIVGVALLVGLCLVELQDIGDELLLLRSGLSGGVSALRRLSKSHDCVFIVFKRWC